jgi:type III restriction enzyme
LKLKASELKDKSAVCSLIVKVGGKARKGKSVKVSTARDLWVKAVNNHNGFGRWDLISIADPGHAQTTIRRAVSSC